VYAHLCVFVSEQSLAYYNL